MSRLNNGQWGQVLGHGTGSDELCSEVLTHTKVATLHTRTRCEIQSFLLIHIKLITISIGTEHNLSILCLCWISYFWWGEVTSDGAQTQMMTWPGSWLQRPDIAWLRACAALKMQQPLGRVILWPNCRLQHILVTEEKFYQIRVKSREFLQKSATAIYFYDISQQVKAIKLGDKLIRQEKKNKRS